MLKTAKTSEQELIRKRALADKMAKKRARRDAIIPSILIFTLIWIGALRFTVINYLALCVFGLLISALCAWLIKESRYNKYYKIYSKSFSGEGMKNENG